MAVGAVSALVVVAFRLSLHGLEALRQRALHLGFIPYLLLALACCVGCVMSAALFAPEAGGGGVSHVKAVLWRYLPLRWRRILPVKFFGSLLGIGGGMALGPEGPTVHMGAAVGQGVAEALGSTTVERQTLIAAGAGAGLAAAFNAPVAGMIFVLEEVQRDFTPTVFIAALVASLVADVVTRVLTGQVPVFEMHVYPAPPLEAIPVFLALGVMAGVGGVLYNKGLILSLDLFGVLKRPWLKALLIGLVIGGVGWVLPQAMGSGYPILHTSFRVLPPFKLVALLLVARYLLTMSSYGSGAPGGLFAPLLVLGSLNGDLVAHLAARFFPHLDVAPPVYVVVAMAAWFTAVVRAPLTGIVLITEMTNNFNLTVALLVASAAAYAVGEVLHNTPIYEALLERVLVHSKEVPELGETILLRATVARGSPFDGATLKDLSLPHGCVIVTVERGAESMVPSGDTRLEAGDRLTAVVAPMAGQAIDRIRDGVEAPVYGAT